MTSSEFQLFPTLKTMSTNPFAEEEDDSDGEQASTNPFSPDYKGSQTSKTIFQSSSSDPGAKSSTNPFSDDDDEELKGSTNPFSKDEEDNDNDQPEVSNNTTTHTAETNTNPFAQDDGEDNEEDEEVSNLNPNPTQIQPPSPPQTDRAETPEAVRMRRAVSEALRGSTSSPSRHSTASSITSPSPSAVAHGSDLIFDGARGSSFTQNQYQNPRFMTHSLSHSTASTSDHALAHEPMAIPYPDITFSTPPMFKSLTSYIHGGTSAELNLLDSDVNELEHTLSLVESHVEELKEACDFCMDECLEVERKFHQGLGRKKEEVRRGLKQIFVENTKMEME